MVIPLMKQADEQGGDEPTTLHFSAAWAEGTVPIADARRAVRALLTRAPKTGRTPPPALLTLDAELVVSELLTNAVRHAPGPCGINLQLSSTELSITVWDTSPHRPVMKRSDPSGIGGHGMRVVHMVSHTVDVTLRTNGKHITAHLHLTSDGDSGATATTVIPTPRPSNPQHLP
ncbi:ATP-binding protein [Streptomyces luteogriseus]|uniref:ATP-binding protein n=1 Tax=Streptomyces luteogriseus TaxID=68233 RepID=UPI0036B37265